MAGSARPRLHFLDGLRGLACVYVLLFHEATQKIEVPGHFSPALGPLRAFLNEGRHSVVFFIVLSGFSLMLPVSRAGAGELVGGFWSYIKRRAKRIMPPYYTALLGSLLLIVAYNRFAAHNSGEKTLDAALSAGSILSHVALIHNLNFDWAYRINGPMWSVATEWQIYFLFALLLLPLRRKVGMPVTIAIAWLLFGAPSVLLSNDYNLYWASPWFVGSFALGMYGADLGFAPATTPAARTRLPWRWLTLGSLAWVVAIAMIAPSWPYLVVDFGISVFAFSWIGWCLEVTQSGAAKGLVLRFLESRALVYLGGFSYSLYLVQHPLLRFSEKALNKLHVGHDANLLLHLFLVTPVIILVAWVFAELFERPFTTGGLLWPALQRRFRRSEPQA